MAINIKEIFKSDLDPNGTAWWSKDKIDKINYNFNQLSNGGMPGPQGYAGMDGSFGPNGIQGPIGYMGPQGLQGPQGAFAPSDWVYFKDTPNNVEYLFPKANDLTPIQYSSIVMRIGIDATDPLYTTPADYTSYTMLSNIKVDDANNPNFSATSPKINLRLQHEGKVSDWKIVNNNGTAEIHIGKFVTSDPDFQLIHLSENTKINTIDFLGAIKTAHDIKDSLIKINAINSVGGQSIATVEQGSHFRSNDTFIYNNQPTEGFVLVSQDVNGNVEWKNKKSVFENFPIGTIISIRESDFNSNNFYLDVTLTNPNGEVLKNIYGKGKENTDYEGWYLCNGETWEFAPNVSSYLTPNLNSFNYDIDTNNGDQDNVTDGNNSPIIIGGYDISMSSVYNGNGSYTTQFTNTWEDNNTSPTPNDTIDFGAVGGNTAMYVSRMVHIVYLERNDLVWTNADGSVPPPPTTTNISLTYRLTNGGGTQICNIINPQENLYSWTGGAITNWENPSTLPGIYLYNNNTTTFAPTGYYMRSTAGQKVWRKWDSTTATFTVPTTCGISVGVQLVWDENIENLNGDIADLYNAAAQFGSPILDTYIINGSSFEDSTSMYAVGQSGFILQAGWYREVTPGSSGVRRYWDGTSFQGETLTAQYILRFLNNWGDNVSPLTTSANTANVCNNVPGMQNWQSCYVETDYLTVANGDISSSLSTVHGQGSRIFVHQGWLIPYDMYVTPPLVNIISQNAPASTLKYKRIWQDGAGIAFGIGNVTCAIDQYYGNLSTITLCQ